MCIEKRAHFVSSSYISPEMAALEQAAMDAGVALVNEVGLDPGIDHLMAHELVADYRHVAQPGDEIAFTQPAVDLLQLAGKYMFGAGAPKPADDAGEETTDTTIAPSEETTP